MTSLCNQPVSQVLLAVEVADQASESVLRRKTRLYAQNGVGELWVVNVQDSDDRGHREPGPEGYRSVTVLAETEPFAPLFLPGHTLRGADVLPKSA